MSYINIMSYIKVIYILNCNTNVHLCIDCRLLESVSIVCVCCKQGSPEISSWDGINTTICPWRKHPECSKNMLRISLSSTHSSAESSHPFTRLKLLSVFNTVKTSMSHITEYKLFLNQQVSYLQPTI